MLVIAKRIGVFSIFCIALALSACTPPASCLGVAPTDWQQASPQQRKDWRQAHKEYKKTHPTLKGNVKGPYVQLHLLSGKAAFPPDFKERDFSPVAITLPEGSCRSVQLASKDSVSPLLHTNMYLCYAQNTVAFDPSRVDAQTSNGSLILTANPLWSRGLLYNSLFTAGYVRLRAATIWVKQVAAPVPGKATTV